MDDDDILKRKWSKQWLLERRKFSHMKLKYIVIVSNHNYVTTHARNALQSFRQSSGWSVKTSNRRSVGRLTNTSIHVTIWSVKRCLTTSWTTDRSVYGPLKRGLNLWINLKNKFVLTHAIIVLSSARKIAFTEAHRNEPNVNIFNG